MRQENVKEYEFLRKEMDTVKQCITTYLGYVLGGSGLAVYGTVTLGATALQPFFIAVLCFSFTTIMSFVLLVLYYKFSSHNRFAGYCKLLNHEDYYAVRQVRKVEGAGNRAIFSWEVALERLRASDTKPELLVGLIEHVRVADLDKDQLRCVLEHHTGKRPLKDKHKFWRGIVILFKALRGQVDTRSWGFPPIITAVFFVMCVAFFAGGIAATIHFSVAGKVAVDEGVWLYYIAYVVAGITITSQGWLWIYLVGKLFSLMKGTNTVDAFFWRFLPFRVAFLNRLGITPTYIFASEGIAEEVDELKSRYGDDTCERHRARGGRARNGRSRRRASRATRK